jgi:hypothetical protein
MKTRQIDLPMSHNEGLTSLNKTFQYPKHQATSASFQAPNAKPPPFYSYPLQRRRLWSAHPHIIRRYAGKICGLDGGEID